jgi:Ca2+-binding EF-hand superfamily protein
MDKNKNGKLSKEEFSCACFFVLDKDGHGKLSREEYEAGFEMFDTDKDGKITRFEFTAATAALHGTEAISGFMFQ